MMAFQLSQPQQLNAVVISCPTYFLPFVAADDHASMPPPRQKGRFPVKFVRLMPAAPPPSVNVYMPYNMLRMMVPVYYLNMVQDHASPTYYAFQTTNVGRREDYYIDRDRHLKNNIINNCGVPGYGNVQKNELCCVFCLEDVWELQKDSDAESVATLDCGHLYHFDCIQKWLKDGQNCCLRCLQQAIVPEPPPKK